MGKQGAWLWSGLLLLVGAGAVGAWAQGELLPLPQEEPIRAAHYPALSPDGKSLCFSYQGDLWTVPSAGGTATRLTVHEAHDAYPRWSPDGRWIAFSSNRDGSGYDLHLVPAQGGATRQLTFHSASDIVNDWSPDGTRLLFDSGRGVRGFEECELDLKSGVVKTLTRLETGLRYASYSPDGKRIAYTLMPGVAPFWRPKYRGSANAEIHLLSLAENRTERLTDYEGMDMWPMWSADGKSVYYVTDELDGTPNLVRKSVGGGKPAPVTRHSGDAVRFPSIARDGSLVAYGVWRRALDHPAGGRLPHRTAHLRPDRGEREPDPAPHAEQRGHGAGGLPRWKAGGVRRPGRDLDASRGQGRRCDAPDRASRE